MADLPEIGYGTVTGRFVAGILDTNDPGAAPDAVPLRGTVEFWPTADVVRVPIGRASCRERVYGTV